MSVELQAEVGPLACVHCAASISLGELFLLGGRCAMGGAVAGVDWKLYGDLLEPEGEHLVCAANARGTREAPVCFTVGHGTRTLAELVDLLGESEIQVVADIRTVPKSRHNPQTAGAALAQDLPTAGLCYLHLPGLGGLRKTRADSPNGAWRNTSFRGYADYMLTPEFDAALEELLALLQLRRTAIMCAETVYWRCHRSLVADALLVRGIESIHLMGPGKRTPHTLTRFAQVSGTRLLYPLAAGEPPDSS